MLFPGQRDRDRRRRRVRRRVGGVALTLAAATLGAVLAFLLARGAGAAPIGRLLGPRAAHWRDWIADRERFMEDPLGPVPGWFMVVLGDVKLERGRERGSRGRRARCDVHGLRRGDLGPVALLLTAHSDVLDDYGAGASRDPRARRFEPCRSARLGALARLRSGREHRGPRAGAPRARHAGSRSLLDCRRMAHPLQDRTRYDPEETEARVFARWEESGRFHPEPEGHVRRELLDRHPAAERHRRAAHGARAQRGDPGHADPPPPHAGQADEVDPRHRPRRHRDPDAGRAAAAKRRARAARRSAARRSSSACGVGASSTATRSSTSTSGSAPPATTTRSASRSTRRTSARC